MAKTVKDLKADTTEIMLNGGITNSERFRTGLPLLTEIQDRIGKMKASIRELQLLAKQLVEGLSDYADTHKTALTTPLAEVKDELEVGEVNIDGVDYIYTRSWSGLARTNGDNITEMFLQGLPPTWVRVKHELDVGCIGRCGYTDAELADKGLMWKRKRTWEVKS